MRAPDGLSFSVEQGEVHGFLGPNDAGKLPGGSVPAAPLLGLLAVAARLGAVGLLGIRRDIGGA